MLRFRNYIQKPTRRLSNLNILFESQNILKNKTGTGLRE